MVTGRRGGGGYRYRGQNMATEGDVTLGEEHAVPCKDDVSSNRTLEAYII